MRVLLVSAHYPPNFVSGGTLVPARIAAGLAARGHEVAVYAGHLDPNLPPLTAWEERGDDDVLVRWVVTTPWTNWADVRNYDHPAVTGDFAAFVDRWQPDVVHAHSLQTLGAGLLPAVTDRGVPVALTMHDFWWTCARQFLVDREMVPCSLVVDCGVCACEAGRPALDARDAVLRRALESVDLVIAPSAIAARVLGAEAVEDGRLIVDENGIPTDDLAAASQGAANDADDNSLLPAVPPTLRPAMTTAPVRFLFAGGPVPLKGWPVLAAALRTLLASGPAGAHWTCDVYGVEADGITPDGRTHPRDPAIRYHRPFDPTDRAAVMAAADVLVLPSVMRESHSILTREALLAGLPVICSDTLGPEEVVADDINGLVVPAGDALALSAALQRLANDPDIVTRYRSAPPPSGVRTVDEQIVSTEALLAELVETTASLSKATQSHATSPEATQVAESTRERRLSDPPFGPVLFIAGIEGAPLRYRARLPAEALARHGVRTDVRHYRDPELPELVARAAAIVFYRVPATRQVIELIDRVHANHPLVPVLFDVDDLIVDPALRGQLAGLANLPAAELDLWWHGVARYRTTLEHCDAYVGSTPALVREVAELTGLPSFQYANGVGALLGRASDAAWRRPRAAGPRRLGYFSGTTTHDHDWAAVEPAVVEVMQARPDVELWLGGHIRPTAALAPVADRVRQLPPVPWYELPQRLRDLDVNLAPLALGGIFNEAKSAIKWLEAALVGTPTVASPSEPFAAAIECGVNGELADGHDEWVAALGRLLDDPLTRARQGARARRDVLLDLSPWRQGQVYLDILTDVTAELADAPPGARIARHGRSSGEARESWHDVADDEPAVPVTLEPYNADVPAFRRTPKVRGSEARALIRRAVGGGRRFVRLRAEVGTTTAVVRVVRSARGRVARSVRS